MRKKGRPVRGEGVAPAPRSCRRAGVGWESGDGKPPHSRAFSKRWKLIFLRESLELPEAGRDRGAAAARGGAGAASGLAWLREGGGEREREGGAGPAPGR